MKGYGVLRKKLMSYTKEQTMLAFAYISYFGVELKNTSPTHTTKIYHDIKHALKTWNPVKDTAWELVWGPDTFAFKHDKFDDNLMYVVREKQRGKKPRYVVAIRGTNPFSLKDWLFEDFTVLRTKPWAYAHTAQQALDLKPRISHGTDLGVRQLQQMQPQAGLPGAGKTLLAFLNDELDADKPAEICVTGHSLGGALAPTVALWLNDIKGEQLPESLEVSTVAFAGATAGNKDFAAYSDHRLGHNCIRVANSLDVVPYAWNLQSLTKLYSLYTPYGVSADLGFKALFAAMIAGSVKNHYTQIQADTPALPGKFQPMLKDYLLQGLYQHVVGYPQVLGMLENNDIPLGDLLTQDFIPMK